MLAQKPVWCRCRYMTCVEKWTTRRVRFDVEVWTEPDWSRIFPTGTSDEPDVVRQYLYGQALDPNFLVPVPVS